jgi:hypothetical protein
MAFFSSNVSCGKCRRHLPRLLVHPPRVECHECHRRDTRNERSDLVVARQLETQTLIPGQRIVIGDEHCAGDDDDKAEHDRVARRQRGEVTHAGAYPLLAPITVMQALSVAGGLTPFADANRISVMRTENDQREIFHFRYKDVASGRKPEQNIPLKPGDTVNVEGYLAKDGSTLANARNVKLADGRKLFEAVLSQAA